MFEQKLKWYVFLVLLMLGTIGLIRYAPVQKNEPQMVQEGHSVDYFSIWYRKVQMDAQGVPHDKLEAAYAVHYSDSDETELTKPVMTVYKGALPPWHIRSEIGRIEAGGEQIFLKGQVYIDRSAAESVRAVNIKTTNLRVQPKRNYAETDDWAEMVSELDTMSGVGMKLFYQELLHIELLANVKGRHEYK